MFSTEQKKQTQEADFSVFHYIFQQGKLYDFGVFFCSILQIVETERKWESWNKQYRIENKYSPM